jgi:glutamate synthase (NADPH/NADH) small chain
MSTQPEKPAKKKSIPRAAMPEQAPEVRRRNFEEVPLGYTKEMAMAGGVPLPAVQKTGLCRGMPGECGYPRFYQADQRGRFHRCHPQFVDQERLAGGLRAGLSPGNPV